MAENCHKSAKTCMLDWRTMSTINLFSVQHCSYNVVHFHEMCKQCFDQQLVHNIRHVEEYFDSVGQMTIWYEMNVWHDLCYKKSINRLFTNIISTTQGCFLPNTIKLLDLYSREWLVSNKLQYVRLTKQAYIWYRTKSKKMGKFSTSLVFIQK
jgi:hypothetical protein